MIKQHAFPTVETNYDENGNKVQETKAGMSLRDYFAAKALPALITLYAATSIKDKPCMSRIAYSFAEEMLKARE